MKRTIVALSALLMVSGCISKTEYGECIGVADQPDLSLTYKASVRNIVLGVVFIETIFAPIIVLVSEFKCPIGRVHP